jgi:hypothetical protein
MIRLRISKSIFGTYKDRLENDLAIVQQMYQEATSQHIIKEKKYEEIIQSKDGSIKQVLCKFLLFDVL